MTSATRALLLSISLLRRPSEPLHRCCSLPVAAEPFEPAFAPSERSRRVCARVASPEPSESNSRERMS